MNTVLLIEDLKKSYRTGWRKPRRTALRGLSLQVPAGVIMGLLGPNGAGKTTTLKAVMGLLRPDSGRISLFGKEAPAVEARAGIGFLPEQPYFDLYLTPRALLGYYGRLAGVAADALPSRISHMLNLVGLGEEIDLPMARFSKGMLQRVGLAQALIADPEFLILDEPSAGLDPMGKLQVRELLEQLRKQGKTVLLSSHQLSEIEEICDGVTIVNRGRDVVSGSLDELLSLKDEYEICLETPMAGERPELPASAAWADDNAKKIVLRKEDLNRTLGLLVERGAVLTEVKPRRMSLEEFFVSRIGEKREGEEG